MKKYGKSAILIILIALISQVAHTQTLGYAQQYEAGAVILADGTQVRGTIMLYPSRGVVQVKADGDSVQTYEAQAVQCVAVEEQKERIRADKLVSVLRVFRPYYVMRSEPSGPAWAFFEQISDGPVKLLRYQRLMLQNASTEAHMPSIDSFFLVMGSNNVLPLRYPRKDLLSFFKQQAPQIEQYAKENNLRYTNARELSFIVNYANSLSALKQ